MKKVFLILVLALASFTFTSCEDECTQPALCTLVSQQDYGKSSYAKVTTSDKVDVCHNGMTISIDVTSLQDHLDHGDTEGECETLSDGGLVFRGGEVVEISCDYSLPFLHTTDNGTQWLYTEN